MSTGLGDFYLLRARYNIDTATTGFKYLLRVRNLALSREISRLSIRVLFLNLSAYEPTKKGLAHRGQSQLLHREEGIQ